MCRGASAGKKERSPEQEKELSAEQAWAQEMQLENNRMTQSLQGSRGRGKIQHRQEKAFLNPWKRLKEDPSQIKVQELIM